MRNMHLEAAIWNLFTSPGFYEGAARECEETMKWFGAIAIARKLADLGRNNQIFDTLKALARDFRRGSELAQFGDYQLIWDTAAHMSGDVRGFMEQALQSWMTPAEYKEFSEFRIGRVLAYSTQIARALNNAMVKGESFFRPNPDCPERSNDDDGFPEDKICQTYSSIVKSSLELSEWKLPNPLPEYAVDKSTACQTGEEVPWTGVWYPDTGLEKHSLTFAVKGRRMQPAFQVIKTVEQRKRESGGAIFSSPETVAVATTWHPLIAAVHRGGGNGEIRAKAGERCPKAGVWQPMEPDAAQRTYEMGESMANLGSAYGLTVWRWLAYR